MKDAVDASISFSNGTASAWIDKIANEIKTKLSDDLKTNKFRLQIYETTSCNKKNLLTAYVRYSNINQVIIDEFLFAEQLDL